MSVETVEKQLLSCPSLAAKEAWVRAQVGKAAQGKSSRDHIDRIHDLLKQNRRHEAAALTLSVAMADDGNALVANLRRRGVLRASRYGFKVGALRELVRLLGRLHDTLGLENRWVQYLESVDALYELASEAKRLHDGLLTRLSRRRGKALKTFLVLTNQTFAHGGLPDPNATVSPTRRISPEDIASAVSRVIALYREAEGLHKKDFLYTDEQALDKLDGTYSEDLHCALRLEELYQAETLIDGLPYRAQLVGNDIVVESIDLDVEKSVRLGYVQMELQVLIRRLALEKLWEKIDQSPVSLVDIFKVSYEGIIEHFVEIKTWPLPRITFGIPNIPDLFKPLADDRYFREDLLALLQLSVEDYEDFELEPFEVAPGVLSIDLFKINRLFALMGYLFQRELEKVADPAERRRLALHSVVPVMRREQLLALLGTVLPQEKTESILALLVCDETRELVDLQYTPFLKVDDYYLLAPSLIAHSNLGRNVAFANRLNADRLDGDDPMQAAVAQALREAGFRVGVEVSDSKKSKTGDTDLLAYRDGVLYLFECKNAYHPCNPHEMRNSYDHIRKAGTQLTLRQQKFGEAVYQAKVWETLGWDLPRPTATRTAVLIANRVFTGTLINGHPVRQAHEFINVVSRGEIRGPDTVYRFWEGDALTTADLDRYLTGDGLLSDHFASMEPIDYTYTFGAKTLVLKSWTFNSEKHQETIQARYQAKADSVA
jgi:hypothetical protein